MPLHWDVSKVRDKDTLCFRPGDAAYHEDPNGKYLKSMTLALVSALGWAGIGSEITSANAEELAVRVAFYQQLNGALLWRGSGEPWRVTAEDVLRHVGLWASWGFKKEARPAWLKRIAEAWASSERSGHLALEFEEARRKLAEVG